MKVTYPFAFHLRQVVTVPSLRLRGVVAAVLMRDERNPEYAVVYWYEGTRRETWVHGSELSAEL